MSQEDLNEELSALEAVLASFDPPPLGVDRDRVMFLAGQASVTGKASTGRAFGIGWIWPGALAGMTAIAATLLVILLVESRGRIAQKTPPDQRPIETVSHDVEKPRGSVEPLVGDEGDTHRAITRHPRGADRLLAFARLNHNLQSQIREKLDYDQLVEQTARHGFDAWGPPVGMPDQQGRPIAPSDSYGDWQERELGKPVSQLRALVRKLGADS